MLSSEAVKQTFDVAGYIGTGLLGMFTAWQRMRNATKTQSGVEAEDGSKISRTSSAMERLSKVEWDLVALRERQDEMHRENAVQQSSILKQQSAMFDLLAQQRNTLDKILGKMIGLV